MNKKLIALGVAAALAAPLAAQAGVEVYGQARASIDFINNNDTNTANEDSAITLSSNYSRLGFKGDEDLGNGLSALWQIEQDFDIDTGETFTHSRDTFIGLGGGFGTVLAGKLSTPYRVATTVLDPFHDTAGDHSAIIGSLNGNTGWNDENRASNAIAYVSPDMNGFSASVAYILASAAGDDDNLPMTTGESDQDVYSLAGNYSNGPIMVTAGYESWNALGAGGDDATAWKIGGSYTIMDATTIGAIWESLDGGGSNGDRDAWTLNAKHKMGDTALMAAYSMADEAGGVADSGASQISIGVSQSLSKATEVYALYSLVANDDFGNYGLDNRIGAVGGEDMSAFSFGINHKFSSK